MNYLPEALARWTRLGSRLLVTVLFAAAVTVLLLWLAGRFESKVPQTAAQPDAERQTALTAVPVRLLRLPQTESAVGTIRAVHETSLGSKLLARVLEANLKAGQKVKAGDVLVRLDDTDLRAKLQQSQAAASAAEAAHAQAVSDERRFSELIKNKAVSRQDYDRAVTAVRSTEAELRRAQEVVNEVQATLDWATVRAPMDATVIDKRVEAGDTVVPGQVLVTLFDPTRMQLVASVRESLAQHLQIGQEIPVRLEGLNKSCSGTVSEIVPEAQASSRAFQVKVTGPCPTGIYAGMFGRILIPLAEEQVLVIPRQAVRNVGQIELVDLFDQGRPVRRAIRTGRTIGDDVEVLSGLREGEQIALPAAGPKSQEATHG